MAEKVKKKSENFPFYVEKCNSNFQIEFSKKVTQFVKICQDKFG